LFSGVSFRIYGALETVLLFSELLIGLFALLVEALI